MSKRKLQLSLCLDEARQAKKEQGEAGGASQAQGTKGNRDTGNEVQGGGKGRGRGRGGGGSVRGQGRSMHLLAAV